MQMTEGGAIEIVLRTKRSLGEETAEGFRVSPLGLVVAEHVDKIAFFEPTISVLEKDIHPDRIRFTLLRRGDSSKPLDEIIRGYRIGCFRIAREYGLITPEDSGIFLDVPLPLKRFPSDPSNPVSAFHCKV